MNRNLRICAIAAMLAAVAHVVKAQLVINELMQSNIDCIMDDLNEFPDSWVELYNSGTNYVNLAEYSICDKNDATKAWPLPAQTIPAKSYIIIYCDKEATKRHTDFRLESGKGCSVYLFQKNELVDKIEGLKKQPSPNVAYGRSEDGGKKWGYMLTPTPGASNTGGITSNVLDNPIFSVSGGVREAGHAVRLTLSMPEGTPEGAEIRYTTDGTEPSRNSTLYSGALMLNTTRAIRARIFCDGWLSPVSTVQSYIFFEREQTLPIVSIVTDPKYLYDNKIGIYVNGSGEKKNYEYDWRRPINIEMYETDGKTCALNQLCETRIQGGATRSSQLKSLALYANKRFGEKRFSYEFFPDQRPGQKNFKSILMRNAGNDFDYLYMRDAIMQRTMSKNCDIDWQAWRPVIVYINGTYKGMLNIRERSNDDNIFTNYDELEDIDMIENWWDLKTGTWDNYNAFKEFYTEHGHTMEEYAKWMDIEEYINLMATNLFFCNLDFPGNNIVMWRPRTADGKWRWIVKDLDFGLGLYNRTVNYNTLEWIYNPGYDSANNWANQPDHTRLFRRLMDDADFRKAFIDHCAVYIGDFMNERGTHEVWDPMYEMIRFEYPYHRELINRWWPNYQEEMNIARNWIKARPYVFYTHLSKYYKLGNALPMEVNLSLTEESLDSLGILINGIRLTKGKFDGRYFAGSELRFSSVPGNGKQVVGWSIGKGANKQTYMQPVLNMTMPLTGPLVVEAVIGDYDGIEEIVTDAPMSTRKELRDGRIVILRGQKAYEISGIER